MDISEVNSIIEEHQGDRGSLIEVCHKIQDRCGYIPPEVVPAICRGLDIPESQVYGAITFYHYLYLAPQGRYLLRLCKGLTCHLNGGHELIKYAEREMGLVEGDTTSDTTLTLETVSCMGLCDRSPAMRVNQTPFHNLTLKELKRVIEGCRKGGITP